MGIAGATVITEITHKAINLAETLGRISIGQIITGGKNRAQKVANARFQLQGLLKDAEKVQSAFDSASKAVDGTSYGLDAAVSTASQLAASNVQLGEDMDTALRGVAGLAAMTNSNFEDIGNIFATVAGNGRLMGMQLSQISSKGVNAAAVLADAMGKTEEEIRQMTSKGEISFAQFAEAMNDAFGDQAQKANDTLQGALSNVRSALSRIGEIFYSGIIENKDFIQFINDIRIAINGVKKAMEPLKKPFFTLVSAASKLGSSILSLFNVHGVEDVVDRVASGMEILSGWLFKASEMIERFKKATQLDQAVEKVEKANESLRKLSEENRKIVENILFGPNDYGNGQDRVDALKEQYTDVQDYINAMYKAGFEWEEADKIFSEMSVENAEKVAEAKKEEKQANEELYSSITPGIHAFYNLKAIMHGVSTIAKSVSKTFAAVKEAFKRVFSYKDVSKDVTRLVDVFKHLTELFQVTDDRAEKIQRIFQGMFSVVDLLRQVFVSLVEVLSGTLGPVLSWILDLFLSLGAWLGDIITDFNDFVKRNETLRKIASKTVEIFEKITSTMSEFFSKFKELPAVQRLKDYFVEFSTTVGDKVLSFLGEAKGAVGEFFGSISESDGSVMEVVLEGINDALNKFMDLSGEAKGKITDVFNWFGEKNKQAEEAGISIEKIQINLEKVKKIGGKLANSKGPIDFLGNLIDGLSEFNGHIEGWVNSIISVFSGIDVAKLSLIGFAGSITAFTAAMSYFTFNAGTLVRNLALMPTQINKTLTGVQGLLKGTQMYLQNESKAKVIKAYAIAIAVLAASLIALTFVDQAKLQSATKCLATVMGVMTLMVLIITRLEKSSKDVKNFNQRLASFAIIILSLSAAVLILTFALKELSEITWNANSFKALGVLAVMFLGLITLVYVFSSSSFINGFNLGATSLIICAASMWILVKAIQGLTELNIDGIEDKLEVLIEVLFTIAIVAKLASGMSFGSAVGVLAIIAAIWLIEITLKKVIEEGVSTSDLEENLNRIVPVLLILGVMAAVLYSIGKTGAQAKGTIGTILAMTIAILGITYSLRKLAVLSMTGHLYSAVIALIAIFAGMVILCKIIGAAEYEFASAGKALWKISAAIAIVAAVVYFLGTKLTPKQAFQGVTIVKTLIVLMAALAVVTQYAVNVRGDAFYKMAGVIGMLAVIVALLSFIPDTEKLMYSVFALGALLLAFGASMYLATSNINEPAVLRLKTMIAAVVIIAASLIGVLITMKDMDFPHIIAAVVSLGLLMGVFGVIIKQLTEMADGVTNPQILNSIVKVMLALVAAVAIMGASLIGIIYVADSADKIAAAGLALIGLMLSLAACFKLMNGINVSPQAGVSLLIASLSLIAIAAAISLLAKGGFDFKAMIASVIAMGVLLAEVVAAVVALSAVISSGIGGAAVGAAVLAIAITLVVLTTSMIGMAGACLLLVKSLDSLSKVNFKNIKDNLGVMVKLLLIMTGVSAVSIVFGVGLIAIGAGLLLISMSVGIIAASLATVTLSINKLIKTFNTLLETIERMAKDHKELTIGLNAITRSVVTFIVEIITAIAKGIVKAATTIAQNAFVIANAVSLVIIAIIQALSKASLRIHTAIFNAIDDMLKLLIKRLPGILEKLAQIMMIIGDYLLAYAGYWGLLGAMLAATFLMGVMDGLEVYMGQLTDKATSLIISFIAGCADALVNNGDLMNNAVRSFINSIAYTLMNLLDSLTGGFLSNFDGYAGTMEELANEQERLAEERSRLKAEKALKEEGKAVEDEAQKLKEKYLNVDKDIAAARDENGQLTGWKIGQNAVGSASDAVDEYGQPFVKKISDLPYKAVDEMLKSGNYIQDETGKFILSSFMVDDETEGAVIQSISDLPSAMTNELIKSGKWTLSDDGKYLVSTISTGMQSDEATQELEDGTDATQSTILDRLKQFKQDYIDDGGDKASGWISGFTGKIDTDGFKVTDSIKDLTGTIPETTADELEMNSPSKLSTRYGGYWIQGFIIGMEKLKTSLMNSTTDVLQPVKDVMATVTEAVDADNRLGSLSLEPTIRPVVDMSNVYAASNDLSSMFDNTTSFKMAADSQISVNNSNQMQLANQVAALQASVDKLANTDFSHMMDGVNINVNADTTVDGTVLRKTASNYTIRQINKEEMGYMMATGGRY